MMRNRRGLISQPVVLNRRSRQRPGSSTSDSTLLNVTIFIFAAMAFGCTLVWFYQIILIVRGGSSNVSHDLIGVNGINKKASQSLRDRVISQHQNDNSMPHLEPRLPLLPPFAPIDNAEKLMEDTLSGNPTIAGISAILQKYLSSLHDLQLRLSRKKADIHKIIEDITDLTSEQLVPLDEVYRGKSIFPIRDDESIFMSIAAFREHLLDQTLRYAFDNAKYPEKLFVGAVIQNCFGIGKGPTPCRTGAQVVGKNKQGRDLTKVSDAPPDLNGIETFCAESKYKKYCDSGQIRVLYMDENEALGPAFGRYFASKLWGGETFFIQVDSHLEFAEDWDEGYISEVKATKNYPKSVLSAYPPGFVGKGGKVMKSPGSKLCTCEFSTSDVEDNIIRVNSGGSYRSFDDRPKQIAFMAAGFFFVNAEFLVDVPFDPFLPWCFMGEEILLSLRAWTSGWNIYAPRLNLIAHQYRPGRMGLPKFWGSVGRTWGKPGPGFNNLLGAKTIHRIKNIIGYIESSTERVEKEGYTMVLRDIEYYGPGNVRKLEDYMNHVNIDVAKGSCRHISWCANGDLE